MRYLWMAKLRWREPLLQVWSPDERCWMWYPKSWYYDAGFVLYTKLNTPFIKLSE